jgi:hypothetical protein
MDPEEQEFKFNENFQEIHISNLLETLNLIFEMKIKRFIFYIERYTEEGNCDNVFVIFRRYYGETYYFWKLFQGIPFEERIDIVKRINETENNLIHEGKNNNSERCFLDISIIMTDLGVDTIKFYCPSLNSSSMKPAKR